MAERVRRLAGHATTILLGTAAAALVAAGLFLVGSTPQDADGSTPPTAAPPVGSIPVRLVGPTAGARPERPARGLVPEVLVVPALGVRAAVSAIRTEDGALTPPSDPRTVGWWTGGARPGTTTGAAVITGHTVHTGGGAFDDLERLRPGDGVVVLGGTRRVSYEVARVRVLTKDALARASASVFGRSGSGRLVLITCEDWDGSGYLSNVVVTARPVG